MARSRPRPYYKGRFNDDGSYEPDEIYQSIINIRKKRGSV